MKEREKLRKGEIVARNATIATFFLALMKFVIGTITGSVVLIADAFHSTVDILTIAASWAGLRIARRKPTQEFPYGFYKAENLATLFVSSVVIYLAVELLLEGISKLSQTSSMTFGIAALAAALVSVIVSYIISVYEIRVGKETNSESLMLNGEESRLDAVTSVIVLVSIGLAMMGLPVIEGAATILISLLVLKIGLESLRDAVFALMDKSPSKEVEKRVRKVLKEFPIEGFRKLKLRKSGPFVFGEVTISVKKYLDVTRANTIAETIEEKVKKEVPEITSFSIRIIPSEKHRKIIIPIRKDKGLDSEVMNHFGRSPYYLFVELDDKANVKKYYSRKNPYAVKKVRAGLAAVKNLLKEDIDALVTQSIGEISFHTLRDNFVDVYKTQGKTVKQVIQELKKGRLQRITKPTREKE